MKACGNVCLLVLLVTASSFAQSVTVTSGSPVEFMLAAIDAQSSVVQQASVQPYATLLDALKRKCKEDRTLIGDFAVKGVQMLAKKNVPMTTLKFLQTMHSSMPAGSESLNTKCAEVAAALVILINQP